MNNINSVFGISPVPRIMSKRRTGIAATENAVMNFETRSVKWLPPAARKRGSIPRSYSSGTDLNTQSGMNIRSIEQIPDAKKSLLELILLSRPVSRSK